MRAICLGEALIDFIATDQVPLVEAAHFVRCLGGAAVNVAIGLQYNGIATSLVSRVGRDKLGEQVLLELKRSGISTSFIQIDPRRPTKCSFISHDEDGNRFIEIANRQSADQQLDSAEMLKAFQDPFDLLYISGVMLIQEHGYQVAMAAVEAVRQNGALVAFDPVFDISRAAEPVKRRVGDILKYVDVLKANDSEYEALSTQLSILQHALILHTKGARGAIIKYGHHEVEVEAIRGSIKDPTGAGDAFLSGFLGSFLKHKGKLDDVRPEQLKAWGVEATRNAMRIIQKYGGNNGYGLSE